MHTYMHLTHTHTHSVLTPHPERCVEMQGDAHIHAPDTYTHAHTVYSHHIPNGV